MTSSDPLLDICVTFCPTPGQLDTVKLRLPAGSKLGDALQASGILLRHPQAAELPKGIWGKKADSTAPLRTGDRVEIYRPLLCDPKEARRLRYRQKKEKQGAKPVPGEPAA